MITLQTALYILGNKSFDNGLYAKRLFRRIKTKIPASIDFTITMTGHEAASVLLAELDEVTLNQIDDGWLMNRDEANAFLIESTSDDKETAVLLKTQYQQNIYLVITFIILCFLSISTLGYYYLNTRVINTINTTISEEEVKEVIDEFNTQLNETNKSAK